MRKIHDASAFVIQFLVWCQSVAQVIIKKTDFYTENRDSYSETELIFYLVMFLHLYVFEKHYKTTKYIESCLLFTFLKAMDLQFEFSPGYFTFMGIITLSYPFYINKFNDNYDGEDFTDTRK